MSNAVNALRGEIAIHDCHIKLPELFNKIVSHTFWNNQAYGFMSYYTPETINRLRRVVYEEVTNEVYLELIKGEVAKSSYYSIKAGATLELYTSITNSKDMESLIEALKNAKYITINIEELKKTSNISNHGLAL